MVHQYDKIFIIKNNVFKCLYVYFKLSGGPVDVLVEALQSLGVSEGVRLLKDCKTKEDEQSSGMHQSM